MTRERRWLILWQAFVAGFTAFSAGAGLADVIGPKVAGLLGLLAASLNVGTATYLTAFTPGTSRDNP